METTLVYPMPRLRFGRTWLWMPDANMIVVAAELGELDRARAVEECLAWIRRDLLAHTAHTAA